MEIRKWKTQTVLDRYNIVSERVRNIVIEGVRAAASVKPQSSPPVEPR